MWARGRVGVSFLVSVYMQDFCDLVLSRFEIYKSIGDTHTLKIRSANTVLKCASDRKWRNGRSHFIYEDLMQRFQLCQMAHFGRTISVEASMITRFCNQRKLLKIVPCVKRIADILNVAGRHNAMWQDDGKRADCVRTCGTKSKISCRKAENIFG